MTSFTERYGPTALVTGASSGIGEAFAYELAKRGMNLLLAARRLDRLDALRTEIEARHHVEVDAIEVDLARVDAVDALMARAADADIGLLVSNAGFSMKGEHAANDPARMTEMLMVNCHAPLQLTRAFIPRLRARTGGGIILTSSVEAMIGCPYSGAYSASKALVKALGEALWAELREDDIDVLTVCPGATDTEGAARSGFDMANMPNVMQPSDVARLTLDNLGNGPTFVSSDHYRAMFEKLQSLPRRDALLAMAAGMKP